MYQPGSSTIQFAGMNRLIGCIWLQYLLPIYQTKTSRFNRMLCRKTSWRKNFTKTSRSSNFPANGTLMWSTPWVGTQLRLELIWISWQLQHIKVDTYKLTNHNPFLGKVNISVKPHIWIILLLFLPLFPIFPPSARAAPCLVHQAWAFQRRPQNWGATRRNCRPRVVLPECLKKRGVSWWLVKDYLFVLVPEIFRCTVDLLHYKK